MKGRCQALATRLGAACRPGNRRDGDHAEYRQHAPERRHSRRQGHRAARQRHLRALPRLRRAPRARAFCRRISSEESRAPRCEACGGHRQIGDHLLRPGDAAGGDAPSHVAAVKPTSFSPSARRSSSIRPRASRSSRATTEPSSSSSIAARRDSTTRRMERFDVEAGPVLARLAAHLDRPVN